MHQNLLTALPSWIKGCRAHKKKKEEKESRRIGKGDRKG